MNKPKETRTDKLTDLMVAFWPVILFIVVVILGGLYNLLLHELARL